MSAAAPEAGDWAWVDFERGRTTQQHGARTPLVLSAKDYYALSHRSIVCSVTNHAKAWPSKVRLPNCCGVKGGLPADQAPSVARSPHSVRKVGYAPRESVDAVQRTIMGAFASNTAQ